MNKFLSKAEERNRKAVKTRQENVPVTSSNADRIKKALKFLRMEGMGVRDRMEAVGGTGWKPWGSGTGWRAWGGAGWKDIEKNRMERMGGGEGRQDGRLRREQLHFQVMRET